MRSARVYVQNVFYLSLYAYAAFVIIYILARINRQKPAVGRF